MKSLIVIVLGILGSWHLTDIESDSVFQSIIAPIGVAVFLIALMLWLVLKAGFGQKVQRDGGGFWFGGGDGGGDGC